MPHTQSQYQVRLSSGTDASVNADIECWADAFQLHDAPQGARLVTLRNRGAVARAILAEQERRNARTSVVVRVAPSQHEGALAVANLAVAGALVDALTELGIDHTSPEAALAASAWLGIAPVRRHLLGASTDGRMAAERLGVDAVREALELDADSAAS
ncbi:MAG TPA: hypothetical protein VK139_05080 [Microbacteriaceae bacterium]|nr:hypothetical protein [Microbacteriaceae bacterium]